MKERDKLIEISKELSVKIKDIPKTLRKFKEEIEN